MPSPPPSLPLAVPSPTSSQPCSRRPMSASHFTRLEPLSVAGSTLRVFESTKTGLRAMLMETGEPLCSLYVVVGTESNTCDWTHKDDGLPHTLEHAIFLGSEEHARHYTPLQAPD